MLTVAVILLTLNLFAFVFFYFKINKNFSSNSYEKNIREKMQRLMVDFDFQTDQAITILENKTAQLQELIDKADKRILLAGKEEHKRAKEQDVLQELILQTSDFKQKPEKTAQTDRPQLSGKSTLADRIPLYTKPVPSFGETSRNNTNPYKNKIIEMASKGISIELIAEKVPLPRGEIELIISMNS